MIVNPKNLYYGLLPDAKDKKKLLADNGAEVPGNPLMKNTLKNIPDDYFDQILKPHEDFNVKPLNTSYSTAINSFNTPANLIDSRNNQNPQPNAGAMVGPTQPHMYHPYDGKYGQLALGAAEAFDGLIPYGRINKDTVTQPLMAYNEHPYGTGSQAMQDGGIVEAASGIHIKPQNKGKFTAYKKRTGKTTEEALHSTDPHVRKMANFAKNAKKWKHKDGGIIPDNMSVFSPHEYASGGSLTDANMLEHIVYHPNIIDLADDGTIVGPGPGTPQVPANATTPQTWSGGSNGLRQADLSDMLSYNVAGAGDPNQQKQYQTAFLHNAMGVLGDDKGKKLYTDVSIFNQRPDLKGKSPDERIRSYYDTMSNDPDIKAFKDQYRNFGGSPTQLYHSSPDVQIQKQQAMVAKMASGGIMYDDGGQVQTMWGGNVQQLSDNPHDGGTMQFNGASHDNGGIGMHYNGKPVEVEGGETAAKDAKGNLNIFGNMVLPGTKTKFKDALKEIGDKEMKYDNLKDKGAQLVNAADPANKFEKLSFNAGQVMMQGGAMGQKDLADKKQKLADLQKAMLDTAAEHNLDPQEMSKGNIKKAKNGASIPKADDGANLPGYDISGDPDKPSVSDRYNNPGNIKYVPTSAWMKKLGAVRGERSSDGGYYAKFPDLASGQEAMKQQLNRPGYKDLSVADAINKWTGGKPYRHNFGDLEGKKISDLNPQELSTVMQGMTQGEGTAYGTPRKAIITNQTQPLAPKPASPAAPFTPYGLPDTPALTVDQPQQITPKIATPPDDQYVPPADKPVPPTQAKPLGFQNVAGELFGAATNKERPVFTQKYQPQLYQPYQVSFQDRLNNNQDTFNAISRQLGDNNPSALGTLGAQKYNADNAVKADEFRTNQGIVNQITNQNINTNNEAQLKNLQSADTQFTRQSTAGSKTREMNQMIVNSLSSKYAQNQLENSKLQAYENLYNFRMTPDENGNMRETNFNGDASFQFNNRPNPYNQQIQGGRERINTDAYGNVKSTSTYVDNNPDNEEYKHYRALKEKYGYMDEEQRNPAPGLTR